MNSSHTELVNHDFKPVHIRFIGHIRHLTLKENVQLKVADKIYNLSIPNTPILRDFDNSNFIKWVGLLDLNDIENFPTFYSSNSVVDEDDFDNNLNVLSGSVGIILKFMWLVKDNSVVCNQLFFQIKRNLAVGNIMRDYMYTNSLGRFESTEFTNKDFESLQYYITRCLEFHYAEEDINENDFFVDGSRVATSSILRYPTNRITRSFMLLHEVRATSNLPLKITFYVAILETLFGTSQTIDITKNVSYRAANYLSGSENVIKANINLVEKVYDIRSRYIHGDSMDSKVDRTKLEGSSHEIDDFLRMIMRNIINKDSGIFLSHRRDLRKWLDGLMPKI